MPKRNGRNIQIAGTIEFAPNGDVTMLTCLYGHQHQKLTEVFDCCDQYRNEYRLMDSTPKRSGKFFKRGRK